MNWTILGSPPPFWRRSKMMASEFARKPMAAVTVGPHICGLGNASNFRSNVRGQVLYFVKKAVVALQLRPHPCLCFGIAPRIALGHNSRQKHYVQVFVMA